MIKQPIIFILLFAFIIGAITLNQFYTPPTNPGPQTTGLPMKVSHYLWPGQYWLSLAGEKGWFEDAGLKVELISGEPDYFSSLRDMVNGKLDINNFTLFDLIDFNLNGADLVMVASSDSSYGAEAIVVNSNIGHMLGLKGKRIGVSKNTYLEYILNVALIRNNLSIEDVELVDLPGEKMVDEFINGHVDAIVTWEPFVSEAINQGNGHKIFDTSYIPGLSPSGIVFHRSFIEQRSGDVQAFVNVWAKTTNYILQNPKESYEIIANVYQVKAEQVANLAQIDRILNFKDNLVAFTYAAGIDSLHGSFRNMNQFMIKSDLTNQRIESTESLDDRFIQTLKWQNSDK